MAQQLPKEKLAWMYERMKVIRLVEEALIEGTLAGERLSVGHPVSGMEGVAVGACAALEPSDQVVSYHRSKSHALAKGVPTVPYMAEMYGKVTGSCHGKAGESWMADHSVGFMSTTEIVGGNLPLATGLGLAAKLQKNGKVVIAFFGDGAASQGTLYESMNLASIWKLPVIFICDNNRYAESTPVEYHQAGGEISARGSGFNMPGVAVDGQDVLAVYEVVSQAVARARAGEGPTLIDGKNYRYYGHFYGDRHLRYRTEEEVEYYRSRDCIDTFRAKLLEWGATTEAELNAIDERVAKEVEEAQEAARQAPPPPESELYADLYI